MNELKVAKWGQCDNYCIFIASRHFTCLQDFINLEMVTKRFRGNIEKFHYNPISLTRKTIDFFPNVETLHLYKPQDVRITGRRIQFYVIWYPIGYYDSLQKHCLRPTEFKRLTYTIKDKNRDYKQWKFQNRGNPGEIKQDVIIPNDVVEIEKGCFCDEYQIQKISLPSSIRFIHKQCFEGCDLEEISIPSSVYSIEKDLFRRCEQLTNISIPLNLTRIIYGNKIFTTKNNQLDSFYLPNCVQIINGKEVEKISTMTIPSFITSLGEYCFEGHQSLKEIIIPTTISSLPSFCFKDCKNLERIVIPSTIKSIGEGCFKFCLQLKEVLLASSITSLGNNCFQECRKLNYITIPESITSLPSSCFLDCYSLMTILLPQSMKEFGHSCFSMCSQLREIHIPSQVNKFSDYCFDQCKLLKDINIPRSITSIGNFCFGKCDKLKYLTFSPSSLQFSSNWFDENVNITQLVLPTTMNEFPNDVFVQFTRLKQLTISSEWIIEGNRLFKQKDNCLFSIQLPTSLSVVNGISITKLTKYSIPTQITRISDYCFLNCYDLTSIDNLTSVKEFGKGCFYNCNSIDRSENNDIYEIDKFQLDLSSSQLNIIEQWTNKQFSQVIFDSNVDDWTLENSVFQSTIIGYKQLVFLIEEMNGEKFGYYLGTDCKEGRIIPTGNPANNESFHFNIESNGRLKQPMKYEIKNIDIGGYYLHQDNDHKLITIGDILLTTKMERKNSFYCQSYENFNYHGLKNALCGRKEDIVGCVYFIPKRIIVFEMK